MGKCRVAYGVPRRDSVDATQIRRTSSVMSACFVTPRPVSANLERLQGVRFIVDLPGFFARRESGINFCLSQQRVFRWFMELTGSILAPKDVTSAKKRFVLDPSIWRSGRKIAATVLSSRTQLSLIHLSAMRLPCIATKGSARSVAATKASRCSFPLPSRTSRRRGFCQNH